MGVAVSGWRLAREVSLAGHLGVVSGTAMDAVLARRLQDGDPGGHYRRALAHFPSPAMARAGARHLLRRGRPQRRHPLQAAAQADPAHRPRRPGARRRRQLRRGVAGQGGPRRRRRHQLPREDPARHADRHPRRDARRRRLRAHGRRHPARGAPAAARARGRRGRPHPGRRRRRHRCSGFVEVDPARPARRRPAAAAPGPTSSPSSRSTSSPRTCTATRRSAPTASSSSARRPAATPRRRAAGCSSTSTASRSTAPATRPTSTKMAAIGLPFWMAGAYGTPEQVAAAVRGRARSACRSAPCSRCARESGITRRLARAGARPAAAGDLDGAQRPAGQPDRLPVQGGQPRGHRQPRPRSTRPATRLCDLSYLRQPVRARQRHGRLPLRRRAGAHVRQEGRRGRGHRGPQVPVQRPDRHHRPGPAPQGRLRRGRRWSPSARTSRASRSWSAATRRAGRPPRPSPTCVERPAGADALTAVGC